MKAVILEWDKFARVYRWVSGYGLPMEYPECERAASELSAAGGHFIPVPIRALDGKTIRESR